MKPKKTNTRSLITLIVAWSALVMLVTGVVLYIVPQGRVAYWVDWQLIGLTKESWGDLHVISSIAFTAAVVYHLVFNWKPFTASMARKTEGRFHIRKELVASVAAVSAVSLMAIAYLPPANWIMDFSAYTKGLWVTAPAYEPPYGHAEDSSLATFTRKMRIDTGKALAELRANGLKVVDAKSKLKDIARANGTTPMDLYALIKKFEPTPVKVALHKASMTPEDVDVKFSGTGVGRKTLKQVCEETGLNPETAKGRLQQAGVPWDGEEKLKGIANAIDTAPIEILKAMLIEGYKPQKS